MTPDYEKEAQHEYPIPNPGYVVNTDTTFINTLAQKAYIEGRRASEAELQRLRKENERLKNAFNAIENLLHKNPTANERALEIIETALSTES